MNIRTYSERTPWGVEWYAIDDDRYDGTPRWCGLGSTEAEAIEDLMIAYDGEGE